MTRSIPAYAVTDTLTDHGHPSSTHRHTWAPGHRVHQASPRTIRLWHDGPDEEQHLDEYAVLLRAAGYIVIAERPAGQRPRLRVTHR
ncbi:hypothetical protein [Streptomyces sp. SPB074]|uniref:hypothetical protein n=1 Tax=Streptomyces sp. (strain SPB074) TaxID=465543 RepID=UPI00017F0E77|nr:hypothetical protein [Streptomyces sp. SPB074]EDY43947.1 hypothetical protein SSBG_02137 [Streptomyces sp. SPB074]